MILQLLRHSTLLLEFNGKSLLVDPMFSPAEAWDPVRNSANPRRNPMVDLPLSSEELDRRLAELEAVLVTHLHVDHWDDPAKQKLRRDLPLFCQPYDADGIRGEGFSDVRPLEAPVQWNGMTVSLTGGRHGTGEIADRIGPVSGFALAAQDEPGLYIAGDTIWCPQVEQALDEHQPQVVVVNAGAAQFLDSEPITMTAEDVLAVAAAAPQAQIVAVHMETINHCQLTREALSQAVGAAGSAGRVWLPADGESRAY